MGVVLGRRSLSRLRLGHCLFRLLLLGRLLRRLLLLDGLCRFGGGVDRHARVLRLDRLDVDLLKGVGELGDRNATVFEAAAAPGASCGRRVFLLGAREELGYRELLVGHLLVVSFIGIQTALVDAFQNHAFTQGPRADLQLINI